MQNGEAERDGFSGDDGMSSGIGGPALFNLEGARRWFFQTMRSGLSAQGGTETGADG